MKFTRKNYLQIAVAIFVAMSFLLILRAERGFQLTILDGSIEKGSLTDEEYCQKAISLENSLADWLKSKHFQEISNIELTKDSGLVNSDQSKINYRYFLGSFQNSSNFYIVLDRTVQNETTKLCYLRNADLVWARSGFKWELESDATKINSFIKELSSWWEIEKAR